MKTSLTTTSSGLPKTPFLARADTGISKRSYIVKKLILAAICFSLVACATPINKRSSSVYPKTAENAVQNNDWDSTRRHLAKAVNDAELGDESNQTMATLYYEYGRALGVTCFFSESVVYLNKALVLDQKTNGPVFMTLLELARLNLDQKKHKASHFYFRKLKPFLNSMNMELKSPIEYLFILDEYSEVLLKIGSKDEANSIKLKADNIRKNHQKRHSIAGRTMYASQCVNK